MTKKQMLEHAAKLRKLMYRTDLVRCRFSYEEYEIITMHENAHSLRAGALALEEMAKRNHD